MKVKFEFSGGGSMGPRYLVTVNGIAVGYFYVDCPREIDIEEVIKSIERYE